MIKLGMESGELAKDSSVSSLSLQAEPEDVIGRM